MTLRRGDVIETNYGTGPYVVEEVVRGCTCPSYLEEINCDGGPAPSPEHVHQVLRLESPPDGRMNGPFYLNGYDEETLESVWSDDRIVRLDRHAVGVQLGLFG